MSKFNQLLQDYVNKPYEELLELANGSIQVLIPAFEQRDVGDWATFIMPFICTSLAIDGKLTELEYRFLNDLLGANFNYQEAKEVVGVHYDANIIQLVDQMIDACGERVKAALLMFCLCFTAVDETISREEAAFISLLMD